MRYRWDGRQWVSKSTGEPMEAPDRIAVPMVQSDIKPYMSVVSNKMIDGKAAQREDLKRSGCRLVDPSEYKVEGCRTEKWARRLKTDVVDMSEKSLADQA